MTQQRPQRHRSFGRRKVTTRVCIVDPKRHIRTFLKDAFEDIGCIAFECAGGGDLPGLLDAQLPDLVVLGLSSDGVGAGAVLEMLAAEAFTGKVMLIGARDSIMLKTVRALGESLGLALLPTMFTPFGAGSLRDAVAAVLAPAAPLEPVVDVAEALSAGWLELWYQHRVDVHGLVPSGAEALIRMRHPTWGVVAPAAFLPDRADPNFRALSHFVIERVVADWKYLLGEQGPLDLSINLPVGFLDEEATVRELCAALPTHPAFGGLLIEISAAEVADNVDLVVDAATRLGLHNVGISVDNVGTDWPALMALEAFPFAELKVDRQFIAGCDDDRLKQTVCRAIIELGRSRGVRTAAIGVETRGELATALSLGFDLLQGHLFGKPMPVKKFARAAVERPALD